MTKETQCFDPADWLTSDSAIVYYIEDAIANGTAAEIYRAFATAARAKGVSEIPKASGFGMEPLDKALRAGSKPSFVTILQLVRALGLKLSISLGDEMGPQNGAQSKGGQHPR